jgi:hypothetical protein
MKPGVQRSMGLFFLAFLFTAASAYPLAIVCYALLGATYRLSGDVKKALGVALWAAVSALIILNSFVVALALAAGAAMGIILAEAIERRWSYGWQLTLAAGVGYSAMAVPMLLTWSEARHDVTIFINARIAEFEAMENVNTQWVEIFRWYDLHYENVAFGSSFGSVLIVSAITLCLLERWQRDPETQARRKPTGFQRMRLPDWVVWIAIAAALMWFVDVYYRPDPVLRAISWNTALALVGIYLLNGVSILLFAMTVFKASAFAGFMVMSGVLLFGMWPVLGIFGLFDTWYDFRMRFRRIAMLRRVSYRPDDHDI